MKKVIYILIVPLTKQIGKYLFIQDVIDGGIDVEFWDLSGIYFKDFPFQNVSSSGRHRKIDSLYEFREHLKNEKLKETVFVVQVNFNWQSLSLYFILTRFKCKTVFFALLSPVSSGGLIDNAIDKIRNLFFSTDLVGKFQDLFAGLCKKAGLIKEYDLVFAAGQRAGDAFRKRTRVVDINYHDFDHFTLSQHSDERVVLGDYCVFLDEGSIANEDIKIANSQSLDPEKFYGALNQFFDDVEKKFGLKVVIAAHPGIDYDRKVFGGREVYTGKTCVLVKYSKVVISLASMSVSFAALYKKPIIFICTHEYMIKSQSSFRRIKFVSNILGLSVINIDSKESINALEIPGVDPDLYDNYKYLCLVSKESEGKRTRDIVVKTLKEL